MRPEFRILINGQLQNLERLSNVQQDVASWMAISSDPILNDATLLVVHPGGTYGTAQIEDWRVVARQGGGVLFVSGNPTEVEQSIATALAVDSLARERWRVLATPIRSTDAPEDLRVRLFHFLQTCAGLPAFAAIPWGMLDPQKLSDHILAVYLWCLSHEKLRKVPDFRIPNEIRDIGEQAWADIMALDEEQLNTPSMDVWAACLELESSACDQVVQWMRGELLPQSGAPL